MTNSNLNTNESILDGFKKFNTVYELHTAKNTIYSKAEAKIELFSKCLDEVGLSKSYPFFDITYKLPFLKNVNFIPTGMKNFPLDKYEENLMRNCVRRELKKIKEIKNILIKD